MLYPLLFEPIRKEMVWGYESWDISCREREMSVIENGPLAGTAFGDAIRRNPKGMLGEKADEFPLLVKIISARDDLSVQVHPCDGYARKHGFESGKSEMWYVIETPGHLIIGLKDGATKEALLDSPMAWLNELPVKPGDLIDIPAGLVHAMVGGTVVAEIQQNSDVTFRLYDYGRKGLDGKPRELHIEHALAVLDFEGRIPKETRQSVKSPFFGVTKLCVDGKRAETTSPESFSIYTCVQGSCTVDGVKLDNRRSVFVPAGFGAHEIEGSAVLLKTIL